mgnify:CR=1 FL=1
MKSILPKVLSVVLDGCGTPHFPAACSTKTTINDTVLPSRLVASLSVLPEGGHGLFFVVAHILASSLLSLLLLFLHLLLSDALRLGDSLQQNQHHLLIRLVLVQLLLDQLLDTLVVLDIISTSHPHSLPLLRHEIQRTTRLSRASGTSDSVNVVLSVAGDVVVHDQVHVGNIQAARSHVRRDQNVARPLLELVQRRETLRLRHLSVQAHRLEAQVTQHEGQTLGGRARGDEENRRFAAELVQHEGEVAVLIFGRNEHVLGITTTPLHALAESACSPSGTSSTLAPSRGRGETRAAALRPSGSS